MKPKIFTYLELCKASGYRLTYGLMNTGLEVWANIQVNCMGKEIQADDAQQYLSIQRWTYSQVYIQPAWPLRYIQWSE